jgi:hypothetical protein
MWLVHHIQQFCFNRAVISRVVMANLKLLDFPHIPSLNNKLVCLPSLKIILAEQEGSEGVKLINIKQVISFSPGTSLPFESLFP